MTSRLSDPNRVARRQDNYNKGPASLPRPLRFRPATRSARYRTCCAPAPAAHGRPPSAVRRRPDRLPPVAAGRATRRRAPSETARRERRDYRDGQLVHRSGSFHAARRGGWRYPRLLGSQPGAVHAGKDAEVYQCAGPGGREPAAGGGRNQARAAVMRRRLRKPTSSPTPMTSSTRSSGNASSAAGFVSSPLTFGRTASSPSLKATSWTT